MGNRNKTVIRIWEDDYYGNNKKITYYVIKYIDNNYIFNERNIFYTKVSDYKPYNAMKKEYTLTYLGRKFILCEQKVPFF